MFIHDFHDCWFLTGPTASGKTTVGLELARRIGAEIISMDSMALYRGMDIGTAKPSAAERREVVHHLVDVLESGEEFSLAQYVEAAGRAAEEIRGRGRAVLFVGGTPLYLKALLRGIFEGPPADWTLRRQLRDEAAQNGPETLHRRLAEVDSEAAARLHANDLRRVIRALEVFEKTGEPISRLQRQFDRARPAEECRVFVLDWPREALYERIDERVRWMFDEGLVEEVHRLLALPGLSRTAGQALGYREVIELIRQEGDPAQTIGLVQTHTRQFAKRQGTWFRGLSECRFVEVREPLDVVGLVGEIVRLGARVSRC
ncbi:MAG TPA: tRNA (adenosine(37)-N6)-dimethylallyltransferase MiaA [Thermoguttaceae bacterium]|nr:tRNA (adenosine(37)-N6)-dimethylallyltransferase MiaA [Thermoguttaceae bacterium]